MKIQCELCREIVPIGAFRMADDGIEVSCVACGKSFFVPASGGATEKSGASPAASQKASDEVGDDEMRCPKCETVQPRRDACRSCGLRADLFAEYALELVEEAPPELEAIWEGLEASWEDEEAHERFAECASAAFAYAYAARRYRAVLRRRPDDEIAHRQIERLARMAEASLMSSAAARKQADEGQEPYKKAVMLLIVLVLLTGIGGMYLLLRQAQDVGSETRQKVPSSAPTGKH